MPAGAGTISIAVTINSNDLQRIEAKLAGSKGRFTTGLIARVKAMGQSGADALNAAAPQGEGDDWARGDPPLSESHFFRYFNSTEGEIYTTAPHAIFIVFGFTPHMPPASAWLGDPNDGYMARKAVLDHGTPLNPIDYWSEVEPMLEAQNLAWAEQIGAMWLGG
jgi:hypothetical protein